ncbi:MAG: BPL-N domain-containing protein [Pirellulales bacterium]
MQAPFSTRLFHRLALALLLSLFAVVAKSTSAQDSTKSAQTKPASGIVDSPASLTQKTDSDLAGQKKKTRVGVLSQAKEPNSNTSQGLYISILAGAGFDAKAISAEQVKQGGLNDLDLFIIGGGSGTKFNASLGEDGGQLVEQFVKRGGGVIGTCAGGYSFVLGHNEALKYIEVANARCIDTKNNRWARGKGNVQIVPADDVFRPLKMFYANGPLWEIANEPGFGKIEVLARFNTDIHKEGDAGGIMLGTPAILAGTFGDGRFVLFSAHPEFYKSLGNHPLVIDAARWVTKGHLSNVEKINWSAVFPSSLKAK